MESLASAVSMSRSAFAARFSEMVGESPLRYVMAWRMKKATHMLLRGDSIGAIAQAVGYENDAAFGKAFKRHMGTTPGEYRRRSAQPLTPCGTAESSESPASMSQQQPVDAHNGFRHSRTSVLLPEAS